MAKVTIGLNTTNHVLKKDNLVTQKDKNGSYDLYRCSVCGAEGKRYGFSDSILLSGKKEEMQKCEKPVDDTKPTAKRVRIKYCQGVGDAFSNLTPGSEHDTVGCPKEWKKYERHVWVMGVGEPVRLLLEEYEVIVN